MLFVRRYLAPVVEKEAMDKSREREAEMNKLNAWLTSAPTRVFRSDPSYSSMLMPPSNEEGCLARAGASHHGPLPGNSSICRCKSGKIPLLYRLTPLESDRRCEVHSVLLATNKLFTVHHIHALAFRFGGLPSAL